MKILYSQIKTLLPNLRATPQEIGRVLTMTGSMMDDFQEVIFQGKKDYLLSFEIRQNRADCLSVIGICQEIAAYFSLQISLPKIKKIEYGSEEINIKIEAPQFVKKVLALEFEDLKNGESPAWLKEFLGLYDINSVNLLVDISNYVMIFTGYPSHLLDKDKIQGKISWAINKEFQEITTLDGTKISLPQEEELLVRDEKNPLALAGMVGGQIAAISDKTKNIIAETAIYDRALIRRNSRSLRVITEASIRLEKDLDPNGSDFAMNLLASMVLQYGKGKISSRIFIYYPQKRICPKIKLNPVLPSTFAGVEIPLAEVNKILKDLRFKIKKSGKELIVEPPSDRMDILLKEDVVEEIVRIFGYDKIPSEEVPELKVVKNITPEIVKLDEKIRDILSILGCDEILSWPLTSHEINQDVNFEKWQEIITQNSFNQEFPDMRQSIVSGLISQLEEYGKKNIEMVKIFEIGKIFGKEGNMCKEHESLGILLKKSDDENINDLKNIIETLMGTLGFSGIYFEESKQKPKIANLKSCWDIEINNQRLGIIYKLRPQGNVENVYFAEINLEQLSDLLKNEHPEVAVELTKKIVILDANVELAKMDSVNDFIKKIKEKIGEDKIWSLEICDVFMLPDKIRYTFRIFYKELTDQEAKMLHLGVFNLNEYPQG